MSRVEGQLEADRLGVLPSRLAGRRVEGVQPAVLDAVAADDGHGEAAHRLRDAEHGADETDRRNGPGDVAYGGQLRFQALALGVAQIARRGGHVLHIAGGVEAFHRAEQRTRQQVVLQRRRQ